MVSPSLITLSNCWCRTLKPGNIDTFGNLGIHKGKAVRRAVRAADARLFFERLVDATCQHSGLVLRASFKAECVNYF
jgi:hypothetical protein